MAYLTLPKFERHLYVGADMLRGKMDASESKDFTLRMGFLKRCSDVFEAVRGRFTSTEVEPATKQDASHVLLTGCVRVRV
jgi:type I restriction enzyme M protein